MVVKIANSSSAGFVQDTYKTVKAQAAKNGLTISEEKFHCKGQFKFFHRGRHNDEDIQKAREFATNVLSE
jgi:hypothetical protein